MKLPDEAAKHEVLAVTRRNKEVMAVMSWELYEGLLANWDGGNRLIWWWRLVSKTALILGL